MKFGLELDNNYEKKIKTIIKRKCVFCNERSNILNRVYRMTYGIYSGGASDSYRFHLDCLKNVLNYPEDYGHNKVDMALKITEIISMHKKEIRTKKNHSDEIRNANIAEAIKRSKKIDEYI